MSITPITHFIDANEKAYQLVEMWLTPHVVTAGGRKYTPGSWAGRHRYRITWVNRGDALAEFHELSPHQDVPDLRIPSFWEHSYGELCGLADTWATSQRGAESDLAFLREEQEASTLIADFLRQEENRISMVKNISTFGPAVRVQRDGFPQEIRKQMERGA